MRRTRVTVDSMYDGLDFDIQITRAKFEELNIALFKNCLIPVRKVLEDASLTALEDAIGKAAGQAVYDYFHQTQEEEP